MNEVFNFLKDCGTFFIATTDGDQPRVRPFGATMIQDGRLYICTNNTKECFEQMIANPKVEICSLLGNRWLRLTGEVAVDDRLEARTNFLDECPLSMYEPNDGKFEVLYFTSAKATIHSFSGEPEHYEF